MKTYSIGRDTNCDIVISDATDVISRRHALLNVLPSGKMTIVDQSSNGTYVNGIRISQNVPVPVTRKDTISFAHVAKLDWGIVPKERQWTKYIIAGVVLLIVVVGAVIGVRLSGNHSANNGGSDASEFAMNDSISKAQLAAKEDSLKKSLQDSIAMVNAKLDSLNNANRKAKQEGAKKEAKAKEAKKSKASAQQKEKQQDKSTSEKEKETKKPARAI
jgi:hypothetical protein